MELFKILRDKGSLTQNEYELLVTTAETEQEKTEQATHQAADKRQAQITELKRASKKLAWAEKIKIQGDLRTRYQYQDQTQDNNVDRSRGRLRYRLGVIANPMAALEVGAGLASGGNNQRSNNQSFDATFTSKGINLDYAYMRYEFGSGITTVAGKFKRKTFLWAPTDVMWDSDINPEGFSANYRKRNEWGEFFANTGVWVLEENSRSSDDPFMTYGQLGQKWKTGNWFGTLSGAVYAFADANAVTDFTASEGTNTDHHLGSINVAGELGTNIGGGKARVLGEYINNWETDTDTAWALGAKYSWHKWSIKYIYADVESNSVPDFLPDSDRFDGLTGIRGHEFEVKYKIFEKVTFGVDYYHAKNILTDANQDVLQIDMNVKF